MKTRIYVFVLMVTLIIIIGQIGFAQDNSVAYKKVGLTASLQTHQMDIMVPFLLTNRFTLSPSLMVVYVEDTGTDIGLGLVPKYYLTDNAVRPFVSGRIGMFYEMPKEGKETFDLLFGAGFGAEYFINAHVSLGIEAQLNATKSDKLSSRFGNPGGLNFNTATAISGTIYF